MKLVQRGAMLGVVLFLFAMGLTGALPQKANAAQQTQSYDLTINSQVVGPPPTTPPTIDTPADGTSFDAKQIDVKGSCITALVVKVYRNNLFAGSALCDTNGTYTLSIDLVEGRNDLVARQYDAANQASPDSDTVTVYYIPPAPPVVPREDQPAGQQTAPSTGSTAPQQTSGGQNGGGSSNTAPFQLILNYEYTLQAIFPGQTFQFPITFTGGTAPYAISIDWGDGTSDVFVRDSIAAFNVNHKYTKPGFYTIKIKISDKNGQQASMQFVLIVNGSSTEALIDKVLNSSDPRYFWIRIVGAALIVASWVGAFALGGAFQFHRYKIVRRK